MILSSDQILDDQVKVGDHYRVTYRMTFPVLKEVQSRLLAEKVKAQEPRIGNVVATVKGDLIVLDFDVLKNPFPLVAVLAAVSVVAGGMFLLLSLERVEKITTSPLGVAAIVAVVVGIWLVVGRRVTA